MEGRQEQCNERKKGMKGRKKKENLIERKKDNRSRPHIPG